MTANHAVFESAIDSLDLVARGKVRDVYAVDDDHLAIIATDRLSAFDVVLPDPVPGKGIVLTQLSRFWFARMASVVPNHTTTLSLADVAGNTAANRALEPRAMIVRRTTPLPVEAVARGFLIGSGWLDYQQSGAVCGHALPAGLEQAAELDTPLFTPATKADVGDHDENIDFDAMAALTGDAQAQRIRDITLAIFAAATGHARPRGIIIADTKLEFGIDRNGELILIDELLTPDSSRFWPADQYEPGRSPPSFDKQFVRDHLDALDWDKTAPGPRLPDAVIDGTAARYRRAFELLTAPA
ncbi:MAG: phosphoribosylaminoimidazolesuccinocarboxamide synthase [Pseudomonadota bacterium]